MIKYATIGTSKITEEFIKSANETGKFSLYAVYSRDENRALDFAKKHGANHIFTNVCDMAKQDEIDAVYIASPNSLHISQAKIFLQNKKHVICEKPLAINGDLIRELIAIANKNDVVFIEAIKSMYTIGIDYLKLALEKIGTISQANFSFLQLSSRYYKLLNGENPNIFNPKFEAGSIMDIGVYCLYPALHLFGEYDSFHSDAVLYENGIDLCGNTILKYKDKIVTLSYSKAGNQRQNSQIIGDKGTIVIQSISNMAGISIIYNDGTKEVLSTFSENELYMKYEALFFANAINNENGYREKLKYFNNLSCLVCDKLKEIRKKSGLNF